MFVVDHGRHLYYHTMLREKTLPAQTALWIATDELAATPSLPFYERVQAALDEAGCGDEIRELCRPDDG